MRKEAQAALPLMMNAVGYDAMLKHAGRLKVREGGRRAGGSGGDACTCTCGGCTDSIFLNHKGCTDSIFLNHKGCADSIFLSR